MWILNSECQHLFNVKGVKLGGSITRLIYSFLSHVDALMIAAVHCSLYQFNVSSPYLKAHHHTSRQTNNHRKKKKKEKNAGQKN